jgi:N-acetylneuraminic acid mutarotase
MRSLDHGQAARLGDGRVLVVGDEGTSAEVWDPKTATWRSVDGLPKLRTGFALVALNDGRALAIGGVNDSGQSYSSAYAFDPVSEQWSKVGVMDKARTAPAAAILPDGRVLVAGGYFAHKPDWGSITDGVELAAWQAEQGTGGAAVTPADVSPPEVGVAMATAELFDPRTGEWARTGSMRFSRYGAAAVPLADGRVLIVGSSPGPDHIGIRGASYDNAEVYDPRTGQFTLAGSLPALDRKALRAAGTPAPQGAPEPSTIGTVVALADGDALLVGHTAWWKHQGDITRTFRFHARNGTWTEVPPAWISAWSHEPPYESWTSVNPNRAGAVAVALGDGRILVAGGGAGQGSWADEDGATASAQLYDPDTDDWSKAPGMPQPRTWAMPMDPVNASVLLEDGSVLVVGGTSQGQPAIRFVPRHRAG